MTYQHVDAQARIEDVRFMADTGECLDGAARRLGIGPTALAKFLDAHGELDTLTTLTRRNPRDHNSKRGMELVEYTRGADNPRRRRRQTTHEKNGTAA